MGPALFLALMLQAAEPPPAPPPDYDAAAWWSQDWPARPEAADPLGGRRAPRDWRPVPIDNGVPALLYRLWDLPPLQDMFVRRGEVVLEVWARPAQTVRQAVIRVSVRHDGRVFVSGRAGMGCCEPSIGRRVGFDAELDKAQAAQFIALISHHMWAEPRLAAVEEPGGDVDPLCVEGVGWDLTLLVPGQSRHLHRACIDEEVGSVADAVSPMLAAALGRDPRFDVLFKKGADLTAEKRAYDALIARGGRLKPAETDKAQPPVVPIPEEEAPPAPVVAETPPTQP